MSRFKAKITLPNGDTVNCSGKTVSEAFNNLLARLTEDKPTATFSAQTLKAYGDNWFTRYHMPKVKPNTAMNTWIILEKHIYLDLSVKVLKDWRNNDLIMKRFGYNPA